MNASTKPRQSRKARLADKREVICPYCNVQAQLVTGRSIYPHRPDLFDRYFYECEPCNAYVGCHRANKQHGVGTVPLGRLANAQLRGAKREAHTAFDTLWKAGGTMKRGKAYAWLARALGIEKGVCHIGMFNIEECERVIKLCQTKQ